MAKITFVLLYNIIVKHKRSENYLMCYFATKAAWYSIQIKFCILVQPWPTF